jgi:uncharacterized protein YndB with AHSA1/START domain
MNTTTVAKVSETIDAPIADVWNALVTPDEIRRYMFGTTVVADWREGGAIAWKGEVKGKTYEDKGEILTFEPQRRLRYTHYSPLSGLPDTKDNYHTVSIELEQENEATRLTLTQDNNATEQARDHAEKNWSLMLDGLRQVVQGKS